MRRGIIETEKRKEEIAGTRNGRDTAIERTGAGAEAESGRDAGAAAGVAAETAAARDGREIMIGTRNGKRKGRIETTRGHVCE